MASDIGPASDMTSDIGLASELSYSRESLVLDLLKRNGRAVVLMGRIDAEVMGPPSFCAVVVPGGYAYRRRDGVYVIPISCLAP